MFIEINNKQFIRLFFVILKLLFIIKQRIIILLQPNYIEQKVAGGKNLFITYII